MSALVEQQREKARNLQKTICLPESVLDPRTMKAARMFLDRGLGKPLVVGSPAALAETARKALVSLDGIRMIEMESYDRLDAMIETYQKRRAKENLTKDQVQRLEKMVKTMEDHPEIGAISNSRIDMLDEHEAAVDAAVES